MKNFISLSQLKLTEKEKKQIIGGKKGEVLICYGVSTPNPDGPVTA